MPDAPLSTVFRPDLFAGQVALITGGGSGIGRGIADLLAALGAHVVLASRKLERVEAAAAEIVGAGGRRVRSRWMCARRSVCAQWLRR